MLFEVPAIWVNDSPNDRSLADISSQCKHAGCDEIFWEFIQKLFLNVFYLDKFHAGTTRDMQDGQLNNKSLHKQKY
jgi:hypothetical protein